MSDEELSNWYKWDNEQKRFTYKQTEDYIFGPWWPQWNKRIGDMTRDELIHVIATGYEDREKLAQALCFAFANEGKPWDSIYEAFTLATRIVSRLQEDSK